MQSVLLKHDKLKCQLDQQERNKWHLTNLNTKCLPDGGYLGLLRKENRSSKGRQRTDKQDFKVQSGNKGTGSEEQFLWVCSPDFCKVNRQISLSDSQSVLIIWEKEITQESPPLFIKSLFIWVYHCLVFCSIYFGSSRNRQGGNWVSLTIKFLWWGWRSCLWQLHLPVRNKHFIVGRKPFFHLLTLYLLPIYGWLDGLR